MSPQEKGGKRELDVNLHALVARCFELWSEWMIDFTFTQQYIVNLQFYLQPFHFVVHNNEFPAKSRTRACSKYTFEEAPVFITCYSTIKIISYSAKLRQVLF